MAKVTVPDDLVVFEDSKGNKISNDPRFHALIALGIDPTAKTSSASEKPAATPKATAEGTGPEVDDEGNRTYGELKGKDLASFAKERGVEIKGLNAKEVRAALVEQDSEEESEEESEEDEDELEDEESEDEEENE